MSNKIKSGVSLATATALMALSSVSIGSAAHAADGAQKEQPGRCYGVNTCKGQSLCATAKHDCKGQGVVVKTKTDCLAAGGTLTEPK